MDLQDGEYDYYSLDAINAAIEKYDKTQKKIGKKMKRLKTAIVKYKYMEPEEPEEPEKPEKQEEPEEPEKQEEPKLHKIEEEQCRFALAEQFVNKEEIRKDNYQQYLLQFKEEISSDRLAELHFDGDRSSTNSIISKAIQLIVEHLYPGHLVIFIEECMFIDYELAMHATNIALNVCYDMYKVEFFEICDIDWKFMRYFQKHYVPVYGFPFGSKMFDLLTMCMEYGDFPREIYLISGVQTGMFRFRWEGW